MEEPTRQVRETTTQVGDTVQTTQEVVEPKREAVRKQNIAARLVWFVTGVILTLLALRFVLILLGANPNNGFADLVYTLSYPFAAPFFGLFGYSLEYGVSRVEISTLVAMAVYTLIAYGIAKLVTITQD